MTENEGQAKGRTNDDQTPSDASPAEKLEDKSKSTGSLTPGAENPESEEIKAEINPNTE